MGHRKHADHGIAYRHLILAIVHGGGEVAVRKHYTLGIACRTGGIVDHRKIVGRSLGKDHVPGPVTVRMSFRKNGVAVFVCLPDHFVGCIQQRPVVNIYYEPQAGDITRIHLAPLLGIREEPHRIGMGGKECDVIG